MRFCSRAFLLPSRGIFASSRGIFPSVRASLGTYGGFWRIGLALNNGYFAGKDCKSRAKQVRNGARPFQAAAAHERKRGSDSVPGCEFARCCGLERPRSARCEGPFPKRRGLRLPKWGGADRVRKVSRLDNARWFQTPGVCGGGCFNFCGRTARDLSPRAGGARGRHDYVRGIYKRAEQERALRTVRCNKWHRIRPQVLG